MSSDEGLAAGQHHVRDRRERKLIRSRIDLIHQSQRLLRGHERGRAEDVRRFRQFEDRSRRLRDAEVDHLDEVSF